MECLAGETPCGLFRCRCGTIDDSNAALFKHRIRDSQKPLVSWGWCFHSQKRQCPSWTADGVIHDIQRLIDISRLENSGTWKSNRPWPYQHFDFPWNSLGVNLVHNFSGMVHSTLIPMITTVISSQVVFPDDFLAVFPFTVSFPVVGPRRTRIIRTRRTGLTERGGRLSRRSSSPVLFFFARKSITPPTSGTSISVKGWVGRGVLFFQAFRELHFPAGQSPDRHGNDRRVLSSLLGAGAAVFGVDLGAFFAVAFGAFSDFLAGAAFFAGAFAGASALELPSSPLAFSLQFCFRRRFRSRLFAAGFLSQASRCGFLRRRLLCYRLLSAAFAGFFAAGFFAAGFFAAVSAAAGSSPPASSPQAFAASAFAAGFFAAVFFAAGFFAAVSAFVAGFFAAGFFAAGFSPQASSPQASSP